MVLIGRINSFSLNANHLINILSNLAAFMQSGNNVSRRRKQQLGIAQAELSSHVIKHHRVIDLVIIIMR